MLLSELDVKYSSNNNDDDDDADNVVVFDLARCDNDLLLRNAVNICFFSFDPPLPVLLSCVNEEDDCPTEALAAGCDGDDTPSPIFV